jgi:microcystin-dependent protein
MSDLNFPSSPNDGDTYLNYVFSDSSQTWNLINSINLEQVADINISSLEEGDAIVYNDQISNWSNSSETTVPVGAIFPYTSVMIPPGYLVCNGAVLSQSEYENLYAVVGSSYNIGGEASGTFRLPSLTARIPVGLNPSETEFTPLGKYSGVEEHPLIINEMPSHTHTQNAHTHTQAAHNHTQSAHSHTITFSFGAPGGSFGYGFYGAFRNRPGVTGGWGLGTSTATPTINSTTATNQNTTATNQNTGGSQAHNNLQPYIVLNYIIKV